ncbi:MAG: universal stress protein [Pseudomonadota bacterium]
MTDRPDTRVVTACIDGSEITGAVCDAAAWAGQTIPASVRLLHVLEWARTPSGDDLSGAIGLGSRSRLLEELTALDETRGRLAMEHGRLLLADAETRVEEQGTKDVMTQQRRGDLLEALQDHEDQTRLFVLGRLGLDNEGRERAVGSQIETVIRAIKRPVLMTVGDFAPPEHFMLAYDGSAAADKVIERVGRSPLLRGMSGHVVMVGDDSEAHRRQLQAAADRLREGGHGIEHHLVQGKIVDALLAFAEQHAVGLTVMGAYGHSRFREFFVGSNTERMIAASVQPLLLLR